VPRFRLDIFGLNRSQKSSFRIRRKIMKTIGFALAAIAGLAVAAGDPPGFAHWIMAEVKANETKLSQKMGPTKSVNENLVMNNVFLSKVDEVRRTTFGTSGGVEFHEGVTDVFCFVSGDGVFVVGGKAVGMKTISPGELRGTSIEGGVSHKLGAGDVVIIPPKTPHQILITPGHRLAFMVVKVGVR
jgi:mannose-6-phosphate isomerase-like protein (cupin superfamily)